jgi:alpha-1,2-glucosyltransferase
LNVTLFPPLFFFAALYYTDVPSTLSVLIYYWLYLHFTTSWLRVPVLSLVGIGSLLFRQTNIFWVAIFPAGISLVQELDRGHEAVKNSMLRQAEGFGDSFMSVARTSWKLDVVYDARVKDSSVEGTSCLPIPHATNAHGAVTITTSPAIICGRNRRKHFTRTTTNPTPDYIKTLISLSTCTLKLLTQPTRLLSLLPALAPPLITLSAFSAFIIWNGSVVLGDKTNHIATLHLPQLLYIWPYMTFFSWPLLYPYLLTIPFGLLAKLPNLATLQSLLIFKRRKLIPRFWLLGVMLVGACVVVRYNTIVHPFTLADNRHYTFYVFRLLMRPGWVRYAVTPVYVVCGWACVQALGARPVGVVGQGGKGTSAPSKDTKKRTRREEADKAPSPNQQQRGEDAISTHHRYMANNIAVDIAAKHSSLPDGSNGATTSFVIIWLATTTLQLVTAPLVEPRYLILPWIFWRIHVPIQRYTSEQEQAKSSTLRAVDHRLWLETAWMLVINAATGYLFLYRGFEWPQEVGRVQRFMW